VFIFDREPQSELMMKIAREMNLSETAFVMKGTEMKIRWFTPNAEVNLCGHATLAAAHILWQKGMVSESSLTFQSRSGPLTVGRNKAGYTLDFPLQEAVSKPDYEQLVAEIVGGVPEYIGSNGEDCMAVVDDATLHAYVPNFERIKALAERGFLLTARDSTGRFDYLYRGFFPKLDVPEDPVTGSANTCLAPYWTEQLKKGRLLARQVSERGGDLTVEVSGDRVLITGQAVTVFEGEMAVG
ncbi:MAG: PhzF family phenazine biosynthesis protein, partial [Chlamydiia bacterium]|nr:PhzF family phenazine biosynthesis protein [Chlamydiia bacterium]